MAMEITKATIVNEVTASCNNNREYLQLHYCSLEQLLKTADIESDTFFSYIAANCLPQHSYVWRETSAIQSLASETAWCNQEIFYYPPRHALLLQDVMTWHRYMSLSQIANAVEEDFKQRYVAILRQLNAFADVLSEYVLSDNTLNQSMVDLLLENEWQQYLQGVYGICVQEPTPENIAIKEIMLRRIRLITEDCKKEKLTSEEVIALQQALQQYDQVATLFAPYERDTSSRQKWYEGIREKYEYTNRHSKCKVALE
jgi:rubrerythrin